MLTEKDFKELATMIGNAQGDYNELVINITNWYSESNPNFDKDRFYKWARCIANGKSTVGLG